MSNFETHLNRNHMEIGIQCVKSVVKEKRRKKNSQNFLIDMDRIMNSETLRRANLCAYETRHLFT